MKTLKDYIKLVESEMATVVDEDDDILQADEETEVLEDAVDEANEDPVARVVQLSKEINNKH